MTMASRAINAYDIRVDRPGGGAVFGQATNSSSVIIIDRTQEQPVPQGASLLLDFLDEFDADPDVANHLGEARRALAVESQTPNLKSMRLAMGFSQKEFAAAIGTSQSRVSLLESGRDRPSFDTLLALSETLKVDYNQLVKALIDG